MMDCCYTRRIDRKMFTAALCLGCYFLLGNAPCLSLDVLRIDEHWELSVGGPDEGRSAPQVSMVMAPTGDVGCDYFVFNLNHWSYPDFAPGGLEVQRWHGDYWISSQHDSNHNPLRSDGEIVTWVQRLELSGSVLSFEVVNGNSQTWGQFGNSGQLRTTTTTELTRLNDYRPQISLEGSGIGYAGNRVSSLTLRKLVWVTDDGEEHELIAPIDIDTDIDP